MDRLSLAAALPVAEHRPHDCDPEPLPLKMFAFLRRRPDLTCAKALTYYRGTHAEVGETITVFRR